MVSFETEGGRQDIVGVTRGLVDVDIDGNHEIELCERLVELAAVGCGENGIACGRHERFDLTLTRSEDFFGKRSYRKLAAKLW